MKKHGHWLLCLTLVGLLECMAAKDPAPAGVDGVYVGFNEFHFPAQNNRMIRAPAKIIVYPDGKSALFNTELRNVHSIPVRGRFDGNVFTGIAKKTVGFVQIRSALEVRFTFEKDGRLIARSSLSEGSSTFYKEGTKGAQKIRSEWPGALADIRSFDPSKQPYTAKTIDASSAPLSELNKNESTPIHGIFKVGATYGSETYLSPVTRNLSNRLYLIRVFNKEFPQQAVKGAYLVIPKENPLVVFPASAGLSDYGELYNGKAAKNLDVFFE